MKRRRHILETLESRQLLAGPQLIGIQPNEGDLIVNGSELNTAPRVLTLRFDEGQQLDPSTFDGVRVTRAGDDGQLGTSDDVRIEPGLISSGEPNENEVVVRFAETLPDDRYKVEVFGFDDAGLDIVGLRNVSGELFQPATAGQRLQSTQFDLRLGALIEAVVPQPVVRQADGSLVQNRNEIVVYFNEDPLFVEDDAASGTIKLGSDPADPEIKVTGILRSRAFDDTDISFVNGGVGASATADYDPAARTITVTHPPVVNFEEIATAINALDDFDAEVTSGDGSTAFVPAPGATFAVRGNPTERSAENPRFYQLLLTEDTVRTTDDSLYNPDRVIYDPVSHTARLFFNKNLAGDPIDDINELAEEAGSIGGGTFRLRIGTAVDNRADLILDPQPRLIAPSATTDLGISNFELTFESKFLGEDASGRQVRFEDTGTGGLSVRLATDGTVVFDFGGDSPTAGDLQAIAANTPNVQDTVTVSFARNGMDGAGANTPVPSRVIGAPPLTMTAVGDTLGTALDVGILGQSGNLTSLVFNESIDPKPFDIELTGGNDDPGHNNIPDTAGALLQHINDRFGADTTDGITEIAYNFQANFETDFQGNPVQNQINDRQKTRIREALGLWASEIGVQFKETANQGITFSLGSPQDLRTRGGVSPVRQFALNASLRIDPTFQNSAIVFSNQQAFQLSYGEDFLRKATAGIGLLLGLEQTPDLPIQTLMRLSPTFLNDTINPEDPLTSQLNPLNILPAQADLRDLEPVFPGNFDVLHGNYIHRSDSIDVDMYRFEVDLGDADRVGRLTVETFAERLAESSLLDTALTLFQEKRASVTTDFSVGTDLEVRIDSLLEGRLGNNTRIDFIRTDRPNGDTTVRITQPFDSAGDPIANGLRIDLPRRGPQIATVPVANIVDAINNDPYASSIVHATLVDGAPTTDISGSDFNFASLFLSGGGLEQLSRNDDYFSEDSRIIASLGAGTYYVGVAASGNDRYDPTITGSSYGGRTQGDYELHVKFEPQVDEVDVIRDLDNPRVDVPGTPIDADGDALPGGVKNFWFQTRPLNRLMQFTSDGTGITPGQTLTVVGANGISTTYEFVPFNQPPPSNNPSNIIVGYNPGDTGFPFPPSSLASALQTAINTKRLETGVSLAVDGATVTFNGEQSISVSNDFRGVEITGRNIFVDKTAGPLADGSLDRPFNNISNPAVANAFGSAIEGDIVRIVGNGGSDQDITTEADNFSYQIGVSDTGGRTLEDGRTMEIPRGVTTMIDAGAAFKLRNARIGVGSSSVQNDRSGGTLQVLGAPRLVQLSLEGQPIKTVVVGASSAPDLSAVTGQVQSGGTLAAGDYQYRMTFVDFNGEESRPSSLDNSFNITVAADESAVKLDGLPPAPGSAFVARRLYRARVDVTGTPVFELVATLNLSNASFTDNGGSRGETLNVTSTAGDTVDDGKVIFTSTRDRDVDTVAAGSNPAASPGNWGGLVFRRDVDQAEGRRDLEDEGVFLQTVNHADIRFGGTTNLLIDSVPQTVNPIQLINLRPTISFNEISFSADAAMSAAPNSFEETSFQAPEFQVNGAFTADYSRIGPDIYGNELVRNSLNGILVRSQTTQVSPAQPVTTSVRFDDISIVHIVAQNLTVEGSPGGSITDGFRPDLSATSAAPLGGGSLDAGTYEYRMTFVDDDGFESLSTSAAQAVNVTVSEDGSGIRFNNLPQVQQDDYIARRLYRARTDISGTPVFELVASLDASGTTFTDDGFTLGGVLDLNATGTRGRLDGSLVFDPGIVTKLQGSRIEMGQGTQLVAEGTLANPVVFTSVLDDRFGAGGTFDTNNDNNLATPPADATRGNWAGLYGGPTSRISIDNGIIAYGGGISQIGQVTNGFAPIELQQAEGRITDTRFEFNDDGQDGSGDSGRAGRLAITPATIFTRGTQPVIVGNDFVDNRGTIIAIDSDSMIADYVQDSGRQTGDSERLRTLDDNHGPLIRRNRYENVPADDPAERQVSGLDIRGGELTTESIWDDTDIVHIFTDTITVGNFHSSGGLRLMSRPEESLVVKISGGSLPSEVHVGTAGGVPNGPNYGTGITATGTPTADPGRIGGTVHVIGQPGAPVVLTSLKDDTVGAGLSTTGSQFTDTNGDSFGSRPEPNDWRSILLDKYSNDRNVDFILEQELSTAVAPGFNSTTENAQVLGELAPSIDEGDDVRRIGFEVEGYLSGPTDVDVYSFVGSPGSEVWIDIDETLFQLDTVIELLDVNGNLLGRSDNSFAEIAGEEEILNLEPNGRNVGTLKSKADAYTDQTVHQTYEDFNSENPRDAGLRFTLPGTQSSIDSRSVYFFRVRSASFNADDVGGGLTGGGYSFQVRLSEDQEFPGSVVRFADIRYANHGIHIVGLPGESPLLGEAQESEGATTGSFFFTVGGGLNDQIDNSSGTFSNTAPPIARPQFLGNLVDNKSNVISVGGELDNSFDVDFYQIDVDYDLGTELYQSAVFDIDYAGGSRPDTNLSIFYDPDGESLPQEPRLVLFGQDANIAEDRTSPLGEADLIERLLGGSNTSSDAFVGPVSLPEGTYYVAVTESGSIPDELTDNIFVRREPINSVQRLFEDRVNAAAPSTASGPRFPELFSDASITASGFVETTNRGGEQGHGVQQNFDNSNSGVVIPETIYQEGFAPLPFEVGGSPFSAFNLDSLDWSIADNNEIGGEAFGLQSPNTSTLIPHVTVDASMAFDAADFYQIIVPQDGTRVIVDVDRGFDPLQGVDDDDEETPPFRPNPDSVDVDLVLLDGTSGQLQFALPAPDDRIETSDPNDGREGSPPNDADGDGNADVPLTSLDPFFDGTLDAGVYFIGIVHENTTVSIDDNTGAVTVTNNAVPPSGEYRMHVSVEDHVLPNFGGTNASLFFNRAPSADGQLVSESFDLTGYANEDQPRFYFNYLRNSDPTDIVSYTITSDQNPGGQTFVDLINDSQWRQNIVSLNQFAGDTGVTVTFNYNSGTGPGGEGLYLDDFIVGFAERGETVFNARGGEDDFSFGFGNAGEYQLEVRTATEFGQPASGFASGQTLTRDFDTNDRHAQEITLVAPAGNQISDGDTFTISDGSVTQRFEFTTDGMTNFANVAIPYTTGDSAARIAQRIRSAINVTTALDVEAASAAGVDTGTMTDNRLNLFGAVDGSLMAIAAPSDVPGTIQKIGNELQFPALLHNGTGDANYHRIQSQVIIENNTISDAHAIGIWSEPGDRDRDPEDLRLAPDFFGFGFGVDPFASVEVNETNRHPYLEQPPVGNTYPGAVRNLPTLNDSVVGGLAPGVVVRNNTVDQAGLAGIKIQGETRPFMLDGFFGSDNVLICDGLVMAIDAGGTRVVFEFEDISGAATTACGSGQVGGDGFTDGHVPIYYRRADGSAYNDTGGAGERDYGYNSFEMMLSIVQSIKGSILVTNNSAELVDAYIGPSMRTRDEFAERFARTPEAFTTAAVYLEGISEVYFTNIFAKGNGPIPTVTQIPVSEAVQPVAKLVNNTIYGADGIESTLVGDPTDESNDLIADAVVTHAGRAHTGPYRQTAAIGDTEPGIVSPENDVDFYEVNLMVGDRLVVDIDTSAGGPDTTVQIFDEKGVPQFIDIVGGVPQTVNREGVAPSHLDPQSTPNNPVNDGGNSFDPFVDFTAEATGTYYIAVSADGNDDFDPNSLSGRVGAVGGTGSYDIGVEVYAPRSIVMSLNGGRGTTGTLASDVIGTTFTVTQIPDFAPNTPNSPGGPATTTGNQITFEFSPGTAGVILPNGNVNVPLLGNFEYRVPDIMQAIANAVNGFQNIAEAVDIPTLPNHEGGNGPNGRTGPISRGRALALGGIQGDNLELVNLSSRPFGTGFGFGFGFPSHWLTQNGSDFITGFGHDRREDDNLSIFPANTLTTGLATTELYVLFENIAEISLSPEARAAGLSLSPDAAKPQFAQNADQLLTEAGIWVASGASPTLLNNVVSNAHQSVLVEESNINGFGKRVEVFGDFFVKPQEVLMTGSAFQFDEQRNTEIRADGHWTILTSLSTDEVVGASNVASDSDDFNFVVPTSDPLFVNAAGNDFLPDEGTLLIDSAINSVDDRDSLANVRASVGLPTSNVVAPSRDVRGVLRADNPNFATPGAIGFSVFKDRGSNELADFVGPVATTEVPFDNDAEGIDVDPATGFINLSGGTYGEFRIQLRDTGDESDPFTGFGIDDSTVVVPTIDDLRAPGANVTLFEDDRLLQEGIDYTFNYDETKNIITLTPLAGIWQNDRSYRIALNNQDRTVLVAPEPSAVDDGDQIAITDSDGGTLVFEFELGYSLFAPEPITLQVPQVGTNAGGLRDGDIFQVNDGQNPVVVFEFNRDSATLPGSVAVPLPEGPTPTVESQLNAFLAEIAENIRAAIQSEVDAGNLDVDVRTTDGDISDVNTRVVVGAEPGATVNTAGSGLQQLPRTLALQVPSAGVGAGGIQDGNTFVVNNGSRSLTFEFDTGNGVNVPSNIPVDVAGLTAASDVALAIRDSIANSGLGLNPSVAGNGAAVYLNLPLGGDAQVGVGQLTLVGLARPATDGDLIVISPKDNTPDVVLELNRTDEPDNNGDPIDDGVADGNIAVNFNRATTADELVDEIAGAIQDQAEFANVPSNTTGLNRSELVDIPGGLLSVGGEEGLGFTVNSTSLEVTGSPSVSGSSSIEVFGPLLLNLPLVGGGGIEDGGPIILTDDAGNDVIFELNLNNTPAVIPGAIVVPFDSFSTVDVVADNLVAAINGANIGITAQNQGLGVISLGRIARDRVDLNGVPDPNNPAQQLRLTGVIARRGIVGDGEILSIRQGATTVRFEFEAAVGGGGFQAGNVPVPFQQGSTIGDVAVSLAAAINNNRGNLQITATAELDNQGVPTGRVLLDDRPGTVIDTSLAPTLDVTGVPGGATPVIISPAFSAVEVKQALLRSINSVNVAGQIPVTTLSAEDRGGATFFVANGQSFSGPIQNFALPAIADLAGNALEANREDLSTQFTILMPTVGLDYGDAPDPFRQVSGRYPTLNRNNGPRHVVGNDLKLGKFIDADVDGMPGPSALGDDLTINISESGELFVTSVVDGTAQIVVQDGLDLFSRDGDTITIDTGVGRATLEFDTNFRFDEDNFAIRPEGLTTAEIAKATRDAFQEAIDQGQLAPIQVDTMLDTVSIRANDEDGVSFVSSVNPFGVLNAGVITPIEVSVTGAGVLEAWIDFNADGDWSDPGEQIIPIPDGSGASNIFTGAAEPKIYNIVVPPTTPVPPEALTTYARFRVSREGGLSPEGLALSGEVEDYALRLLPGLPPQISDFNRSFTVNEDGILQALDATGDLTGATTNDNGILAGVVDPQGDNIEVFSEDTGTRTLFSTESTEENPIVAGVLDVASDGTFTFEPAEDFNGSAVFTARVTDVQPLDPSTALVNSRPISLTINVEPVNDPPVAVVNDVLIERTINEDQVVSFSIFDSPMAEGLIGDKYVPGPANELDQPLVIESAGSAEGAFITSLGGTLEITDGGETIVYTPPADYNGSTPDTFTYVVADVPGEGLLSETASKQGTVSVNFIPVNDAPRTVDDQYFIQEGDELLIPIRNGVELAGILDNDTAGPADEVAAGQVFDLDPDQFPIMTLNNVMVTLEGDQLRYDPPEGFSGTDTFDYKVVDDDPNDPDFVSKEATGQVTIIVGSVNNAPEFIGINGESGVDSISREEAKIEGGEQEFFDLTTWFRDPEGDPLTFTVSGGDSSVVTPSVDGETLRLQFPQFGFGNTSFTVTASDGSAPPVSQPIQVAVEDTQDPPTVLSPMNSLLADEDETIEVNLRDIFFDPDASPPLEYSVARLDLIGNPSESQIAQHPLIKSIDLDDVSQTMKITLQDDAFGEANIEIAATDTAFPIRVSADFQLTVRPVQDRPEANDDDYTVSIGSRLRIVDPANGVLGNDRDADGDAITVVPGSVNLAAGSLDFGTLEVNPDGTFTYVADGPASDDDDDGKIDQVGQTVRFAYLISDGDLLSESPAQIEFQLQPSRFQNPIPGYPRGFTGEMPHSPDVDGDGTTSAVDALRIVNFLIRNLEGGSSVPVSQIASAPPDFLDVNGDGKVSATDALIVINVLSRVAISGGEGEAVAATANFATSNPVNMPTRNVQTVVEETSSEDPLDTVLAGGFEIEQPAAETRVDWMIDEEESAGGGDDDVDAALTDLAEDGTLGLNID